MTTFTVESIYIPVDTLGNDSLVLDTTNILNCQYYVWVQDGGGNYTIEEAEALFNVSNCQCVDIPVFGCTDPAATNYSPDADFAPDGLTDVACQYECAGNEVEMSLNMVDIEANSWEGHSIIFSSDVQSSIELTMLDNDIYYDTLSLYVLTVKNPPEYLYIIYESVENVKR